MQNTMYGIQVPHPSSEIDEVGSRLWKSLCHHEGALALLELRQEHGPPPYLPLHRVIRRQIVSQFTAKNFFHLNIDTDMISQMRTSILRGAPIADFLQSGADYGEEGPGLELDSLIVRVATLRAKSVHLFSVTNVQSPSDTSQSEAVEAEAEDLDTRLVAWSQTLPEDWKISVQSPPPSSGGEIFTHNNIVHNYSSHGHATIWNRYRALCLVVNSIRLRSLSSQLQTLEYPSQRSFVAIKQDAVRTNMEQITNDLCAGVPFFFNSLQPNGMRTIQLGKYTITTTDDEILPKMGGLLAWPLAVAVSTEYIPEPQRQWLKSKLRVVAKSLGDAVLESVVDQGEFRF